MLLNHVHCVLLRQTQIKIIYPILSRILVTLIDKCTFHTDKCDVKLGQQTFSIHDNDQISMGWLSFMFAKANSRNQLYDLQHPASLTSVIHCLTLLLGQFQEEPPKQ